MINTATDINKLNNILVPRELKDIADKITGGMRISVAEGLALYRSNDLGLLGHLANIVRERKNGNFTFFNRNFHIEPTNVCVFSCNFCSYSKLYKNREDGWELGMQEMLDRVKAYDGKQVTEVHIVGGVHPKMDLNFFCDLLNSIRTHRPDLHIKAFTAVELDYMIKKAGLSYHDGLQKLKEAGLNSLPGGGAEIFDNEVRDKISKDKCDGSEWLEIHRVAHKLGIPSNCTMLYGHIETYEHRLSHMSQLRDLQDETGGFNTFIPLKFRNKDNDMSYIPEVSIVEDLKNYAVARIFMDNFDHIKAYWPMIGRVTAHLSQSFGVDDLDGTIDDSTKIYTMAGSEEQFPTLSTEQLIDLITSAGRVPVERDTLYNKVSSYNNEGVLIS